MTDVAGLVNGEVTNQRIGDPVTSLARVLDRRAEMGIARNGLGRVVRF